VLLVGLVVRVAFVVLLPRDATAFDLQAWTEVADVMAAGQNPYSVKPFLLWPPAWMQILFLLDQAAHHLDVPLTVVIRAFLILADGVVVLLTSALIRQIAPMSVLLLLLVGWSLNPVSIVLVGQHGNFDSLVAICIMMALLSLTQFAKRRDPVPWLWACGWLGFGVLLKTIPLVLAPLLSSGRRATRAALALGGTLLIGPAAYGLSILFVLGPEQVRTRILGYRSRSGWFGVSGLLTLAGKQDWLPVYSALFVLAMLVGMVLLVARMRRGLSPRGCLFAAGALLAAIPALGPGYGSQYIAWFLPVLLVLYATGEKRTRMVLLGFGLVVLATYGLEYAVVPSHGAFLLAVTEHPFVLRVSRRLATERWATLARLPLFAAYLMLLAHLVAAVRQDPDSTPEPRGTPGLDSP
jgi:hypothetical protein